MKICANRTGPRETGGLSSFSARKRTSPTAHLAGDIQDAYSLRAEEYAARLGSMSMVHPSDRQLVSTWADTLAGPVLDAGCGPGHWTGYLTERGLDARGIDQVPDFIEHARAAHPGVAFELVSLDAFSSTPASVAGVLAWYSLIHHEPAAILTPLREFARILRPGGGLLIGFFEGPTVEPFDHLVVTAYTWPVSELSDRLREAHFDVVEAHTRKGPGQRAHGAIVARRADDR